MSTKGHLRNKKVITFHLIFWCAYTLLNYFINTIQNYNSKIYLKDSVAKYSVAAFTFYFTTFIIIPYLFKPGKYLFLCLAIIGMYFITHAIKVLLYYKILILFDFPEAPYTTLQFFYMDIWWWSQYTLFAFGYWFALDAIRKQKELRITEQKQLLAEQEKLVFENAQLRAQINPHFLFNTLSFLYNQARRSDKTLADGIMALTDIMRTSIRKPDADGRVPLGEEIESIAQLIKIYELRYANQIYVQFTHEGDFDAFSIVPHILLTLVENAFKHGDIHKAEFPLAVNATITDSHLLFKVYNRKRFGPKEQSHGIGVHYLKRQLQMAYSEGFSLEVQDEDLFYTTTLSIHLELLIPESSLINIVA